MSLEKRAVAAEIGRTIPIHPKRCENVNLFQKDPLRLNNE
jgi:hypothetical protein